MTRSNPALRAPAIRSPIAADAADRMTIQGTIAKSFLLFALAIFAAGWVWTASPARPGAGGPTLMVGLIGGFVVALVITFRPQTAPIAAPIYAVLEGSALGAISASFQAIPSLRGLPVQAVGLTFAVALAMLAAYSTGLIRATPTFQRVIISSTLGIAIFYLLSMVLGFFGARVPFLADGSALGIGISLVIVGVAALNLILDFNAIEEMAAAGAPRYMEWYGGFALLVTLVWLYLEILRLLTQLRRRR